MILRSKYIGVTHSIQHIHPIIDSDTIHCFVNSNQSYAGIFVLCYSVAQYIVSQTYQNSKFKFKVKFQIYPNSFQYIFSIQELI